MQPAKDMRQRKFFPLPFVPVISLSCLALSVSLLYSPLQPAHAENTPAAGVQIEKAGAKKMVEKGRAAKTDAKKAEIEYMSSDDTVPGYFNAVDPLAHYKKAKSLALGKKYNEALLEINEALKQNPKYYEARYLGALIYQWQGRKQEAAAKYKSLLAEKPNYLQARIALGIVLSDLDQDKAAEAEYKKAIEISFSSCEAHYNFANLLMKENRFKEALSELKICRQITPESAAVHNNLGVVYLHEHNSDEAQKEFRLASELDPANKTYLANLEHSHDKKKQSNLGWY